MYVYNVIHYNEMYRYILINTYKYLEGWRIGPGFFQWCSAKDQEAMGTNWNIGGFI